MILNSFQLQTKITTLNTLYNLDEFAIHDKNLSILLNAI